MKCMLRHLSLLLALFVALGSSAYGQSDANQAVQGGGITVPGWTGMIDAGAAASGSTLNDAMLAAMGDELHVRTGPAVTYWNPEHMARGDYTVRATFHEMAYMSLNNHPHPYGLFIGGTGMGTDGQRFLYCSVYGNGTFIVRGFGSEPFQMNGRRPEANDAVNTAAGKGEPVTQEIAMTVADGTVSCAVNGTVVASYPVADVMGDERLPSTDGIYGIRFGHNTEAMVRGLSLEAH